MCCGCPVDVTRLMEDCYGLMGLKVNVDCFFSSSSFKTKKASAPPPPPHPLNPSQLTTCTFLPSSRNCLPSSVIHLTVMHLTHRWPPNSLCAPRAHRQLQRLQFVYK